jgi:arginase
MGKHLNLFFPQYQGAGNDISTYFGGIEIKNNYLNNIELKEIGISLNKKCKIKNNINGYDIILKQFGEANKTLEYEKPNTIFTIGGGCDADIIPISFLHRNITKEFVVLWFDAHGDINSPTESRSKLFYGMPIRFLLENYDEKINKIINTQLKPEQIILMGIRDLDDSESNYIKIKNINNYSVKAIEQNSNIIIQKLKSQHCKNVYIHIDLDVLDPKYFPYVPLPSRGGLKIETLNTVLNKIKEEFKIIGLGLYEYLASNKKEIEIIKNIIEIGKKL